MIDDLTVQPNYFSWEPTQVMLIYLNQLQVHLRVHVHMPIAGLLVCDIWAVNLNVCLRLKKLGDQGGFTTLMLMHHMSLRLNLHSTRQQKLRRNFTINSTGSTLQSFTTWMSPTHCDPEVEW